jgi:hypothetical protein
MTEPFRIDVRAIREREKAAKAEVLRRFGARGTAPIPGNSYGLSRKQRRLAKLMAEAERRKERDRTVSV